MQINHQIFSMVIQKTLVELWTWDTYLKISQYITKPLLRSDSQAEATTKIYGGTGNETPSMISAMMRSCVATALDVIFIIKTALPSPVTHAAP